MTRLVSLGLATLLLVLASGCTLSKRPRSDRDPYVSDSSSDPGIRVGNPY